MSLDRILGEPLSPGFQCGPLRILDVPRRMLDSLVLVTDTIREESRFHRQILELGREIQEEIRKLEAEGMHSEAEILGVHALMLQDQDVLRQVVDLIHNSRQRAEHAVEQVLNHLAAMLSEMPDPVISERAADVRDLAIRLRSRLLKQQEESLVENDGGGAVMAMHELLPSFVLEARQAGVVGFVVETGTDVSHGAILAKSFGMPVVRIDSLSRLTSYEGLRLAICGSGEVLIAPTDTEVDDHRIAVAGHRRSTTSDRPDIGLWVSVLEPEQIANFPWADVKGVGLYRSEALFLRHRDNLPDEETQVRVYRQLFENAGEREVVFRTLDLGADKKVAHMHFGPEENPCLGLRAHRLFHFHPEILKTQIRAVLRAADGDHRLSLLYPMLESIDSWRFMKRIVQSAVQSLIDDGKPFQDDFLQGVLIETPSAVWSVDRFLDEADFLSVGTNDLVQYLFAVERGSVNVAHLYQADHPIVLQVIQHLVTHAVNAGKRLSICGEMAGDLDMIPVLVGLGITHLSVPMGMLDTVRCCLDEVDLEACRKLARQCLDADGVDALRAIMGTSDSTRRRGGVVSSYAAVDPVCGMVVRVSDAACTLRVGGTRHYFCSQACLERFAADRDSAR
ncbi:MAG: phosphoenolpyruvate--protein phosphotransferase [Chromatiaceae bacterium]|nr:phosphoenolpyruvate--protein phosphotransferase [Chromatiaceae bacterium]